MSNPVTGSGSDSRVTFTDDPGKYQAQFLALEYSASAPYGQFVFGDDSYALEVRDYLYAAGACEFAPPDGRLALVEGRPAGMIACLTGELLRDYRLQAAEELAESRFLRRDPDLSRRLQLASTTLLRPGDDDFYLSRIAVDPDVRGHGIGNRLLEQVLAEARLYSCRCCVLEVAPSAIAALGLYAKHGFAETGRARVEDPQTRRVLEYVHMANPLA